MASISSLGVGSGLDIGGLVSSLVQAEGAGKSARLDRREVDYQAKLSIMGSLKSALTDFQDSYSALKLSSNFKSYTASSTDTAAFTAVASKGAEETSYSITVNQIAKAHKLKTDEFADKDASIATGTLHITLGDDGATAKDVTITDGSLEGIRDAINDANIGIEASIVYNGTGYVLSMAGKEGTDARINNITATTTTGDFSNFLFDEDTTPVVGQLTNIDTAQNASFTVNGVGITSQTNTVTNIIDNVEIELKSGDGGVATETLTVGRDTSSIGEAVQSFVNGYNDLISGLNSATFYDEDTEESGILIGDPTVRGIVTQLRNLLNTTTGNSLTEFNSFASIGILTSRDGTLEYDASKLTAALASKPDEVKNIFAGGEASSTSVNLDVISVTDNIEAGFYSVDLTSIPARAEQLSTALPGPSWDFDFTDDANLLNFQVVIDGVTSGALSIADQSYVGATDLESGQNIAAAIQAAINNDAITNNRGYSALVTFEEDATGKYSYSIMSALYGASSEVQLIDAGGDIDTILNITPGVSNFGTDGAGEIGGQVATFDGNRMTGTGLYSGFVVDVNGGNPGLRSIEVTEGNITKLNSLINSFLDSDGLLQAKTNGLNASINDITEQRKQLALRLESFEARLLKQFGAMDSLVAQLNSTSSFLTNQLEQISNIGKKS